jgi:hypothetical protein
MLCNLRFIEVDQFERKWVNAPATYHRSARVYKVQILVSG